ncbi:MAG TPA: SDR family NAD(P)-dependent oxidoreductase [Kofleriaceae bacterium]|jgi:NAD(P)-dependent dehydrogenase (short-subunit alcohol dehydrogenase family)|nr:SDR family NAD(P)-dependent oxidoreductase [Kofleriaceae bacterium]
MTAPLAGTTAVVTGASRGIGRAIALRLAEAGADVALWARDAAALQRVADEVAALGGRALPMVCDVTDSAAVDRTAEAVRRTLPPVTVVVNNAGAVLRKPTLAISDVEWRRVIAVNLDGTFHVTRAFLPDLTRSGGRVINIASIAGREGTAMLAGYCAAKHAVVGFTRALAEELRTAKVSVNAICPGSVDTVMLREGMPGASPDMSPDDIARTALFLAHTAPSALTGACIDIFG